jgi:aspartokinase
LIDAKNKDISIIGTLNNPDPAKRVFSFSASYPSTDCSEDTLAISLSRPENNQEADSIINKENIYDSITDVVVFSMNGPHFGDRYGIAFDLMNSLEKYGVDILCLSCTIASITGVVHSSQLDTTLDAIKECFEVPTVIKK